MRFGTDSISGKNTSVDPNKIGDHELQASTGTTPIAGVWGADPDDTKVYTASGTFNGMAVAGDPSTPSGVPEVAYFDDKSLYIDGVDTTFDMYDDPDQDHYVMLPLNGGYLIWGAENPPGDAREKAMIYNNGHLRQLGPWIPQTRASGQETDVEIPTAFTPVNISAITLANPCVVTVSSASAFAAGSTAYITGVVGTTEMNGRIFRVTAADATTLTLRLDSTNYTAWSSGGTATKNAAGLGAGTYKYYMTCIVKLSDNTVIESKPRGMVSGLPRLSGLAGADRQWNGEATGVVVADEHTEVRLWISEYWLNQAVTHDDMLVSGTRGVDFEPGFRLYRTETNGSDFYLSREWYYDTSAPAAPDGGIELDTSGSAVLYKVVNDTVPASLDYVVDQTTDDELGAVYDTNITDRSTPPLIYDAEIAGQRLGIIDKDNRDRFYFSSLDGIDYWDSLNWLKFPEKLHAVGHQGGKWVLYGARLMWTVDLTSGIPFQDQIDTSVGHVYPLARANTEVGALALRDDGIWAFVGSEMVKVSRYAFTSVTGNPVTIAKTDDILMACGDESDTSYPGAKIIYTDSGPVWHDVPGSSGGAVIRGGFDGTVYRMTPAGIWSVGTGSGFKDSSATSKLYGDGMTQTIKKIVATIDGEGDIAFTISSNIMGPVDVTEFQPSGSVGPGGHGREEVWAHCPMVTGEYFTVSWTTTGDVKLYGFWLDTEAR